ncbi:MAG: hypothetical protein J7J86_07865 [Bacteroidales bacterium]|nr:hypothetical protein [Bacteroidales bacterium]
MENQNITQQLKLPNSTAVLVLGIISIPSCFFGGLIGLVCGIIALILASKDNKLYLQNPNMYDASSYSNLKSGRVCAIIGTVLSSIYFVIVIIYILIIGAAFSFLPWQEMM